MIADDNDVSFTGRNLMFCHSHLAERSRVAQRLVSVCAVLLLLLNEGGCRTNSNKPPTVQSGIAGDVAANSKQARDDTERAYALILKGNYPDAKTFLERAIFADAMYGPAHNDLGLVLFHLGKNYEAAWEFERAAKLMPRRGEPLNNLGLVYERAEKRPEAEAAYQSALDLDPDNTEFAGNLARNRIRQGRRDEATMKLLELIVVKDQRDPWVNWARLILHRFPDSGTLKTLPPTAVSPTTMP